MSRSVNMPINCPPSPVTNTQPTCRSLSSEMTLANEVVGDTQTISCGLSAESGSVKISLYSSLPQSWYASLRLWPHSSQRSTPGILSWEHEGQINGSLLFDDPSIASVKQGREVAFAPLLGHCVDLVK